MGTDESARPDPPHGQGVTVLVERCLSFALLYA